MSIDRIRESFAAEAAAAGWRDLDLSRGASTCVDGLLGSAPAFLVDLLLPRVQAEGLGPLVWRTPLISLLISN